MKRQVVPERHSVASGYRTDHRSQRDSTGSVILGPVREVQDTPSAIDVSNHLPRERRNVAPDWPTCLPGVAVVACAPENPLNVARRLGVAGAQGVRSLDGHELNANEASDQQETDNLRVAFHDLSNRLRTRAPDAIALRAARPP